MRVGGIFLLERFILNIRRGETPFYRALYRLGKAARRLNMPDFFLPFYRVLAWERDGRIRVFRSLVSFLYYAPMFRSQCVKVGPGLAYVALRQKFPYMSGNLKIYLGSRVTIHGRASLVGYKLYDEPEFRVGDRTYIGPGFSLSVARRVTIGDDCHIASNVSIMDHDGHPLDPEKRAAGEAVEKKDVRPVVIENKVWIGNDARVLKGVFIGEGAVVGAGSVVRKDVPPYALVTGNPAAQVKSLA